MNKGSSIFMLIGASGLVILLGLPLLVSPIAWERMLGWTIPEQTDLANYFGRSLGGVALSIAIDLKKKIFCGTEKLLIPSEDGLT
jgi:hypothetical protein